MITKITQAKSYKITRFNGFTVIELIVVIAVIGILLAIGISYLTSSQSRSRKEAAVSVAEKVKLKLSGYFDDKNSYPQTLPEVTAYLTSVGDTTTSADFGNTAKFDYAGTTASGGACTKDGPVKCQKYVITVKKAAWQGNASDNDVLVKP